MHKRKLTREEALQKAKHYCSYQKRSHLEVKEKLYALGLTNKESDELISQLIEENYVNEELFAIAFARGKFRMKQWGKVKIKYELKGRKVGEYCIRMALAEIDAGDYRRTLEKLAAGKLRQLAGEKNNFVKMKKLQDFLLQKGYENELIKKVISAI